MPKRYFQPSSVQFVHDGARFPRYLRNEFDLTSEPEVLRFNRHVLAQQVLMLAFTAFWSFVLYGVGRYLGEKEAAEIPPLVRFQAVMALVILLVFNLDKALKIWGAIGNTFLKVSAFLNILAATVLLTIFRGLKAGGVTTPATGYLETIRLHPGTFLMLVMVVLGSFYCIRVAQEFRLRYVNHMVLGKENLRGYRRTADFLVPTLFLTVAITAWFVSLAMAVKSPTGHAGAGHTCSELMLQGLAQSVASSRALGALAGGLAMIMIFSTWNVFRRATHTALKAGAYYHPTGKKILVLGAGVTGGITGAYLTLAGEQVFLLDTNSAHVATIRKNGLLITGKRGRMCVKVSVADSVGALQDLFTRRFQNQKMVFDVIILAVKSAATKPALESVLASMTPETVVVSLQNSINDHEIAAVVGKERVLHGITFWGGTNLGPGHLEQSSIGHFAIGEILQESITPRLLLVQKLLGNFGRTEISHQIIREAWNKMTFNGVMNTYGMIFGQKCAVLFREPGILRIILATMSEEVKIANRAVGPLGIMKKIPMDGFAIHEGTRPEKIVENGVTLRIVSSVSGDIRSSMLQDYERGIRSENEYLAGLFIRENERLAQETGQAPLPAPFLKRAREVATRIEEGELKPSLDNVALFDDLIQEMPEYWRKPENFVYRSLLDWWHIQFYSRAAKWITRNY